MTFYKVTVVKQTQEFNVVGFSADQPVDLAKVTQLPTKCE